MTTPLIPNSLALFRAASTGRPRYRLVCFHHAGVGAGAYAPWLQLVPPDVELYALRLPGRESRMGEPAYQDPEQAIAELADTLYPLATDDVPMALYGHSMGGVLAYEVYRELAAEGTPEPLYLAIGATPAPQRHAEQPPRLPPGHTRQDVLDILHDYEGTPPEVFEHPEFLELVLNVMAADFTLFDGYEPPSPPELVRCPLLAFGGAADGVVPADDVRAWQECAAGPFEYQEFDSGHFFVESHARAVLELLETWSHKAS